MPDLKALNDIHAVIWLLCYVYQVVYTIVYKSVYIRDKCKKQFLSEKLFLGKLLPKPKLYSKFELASFNDCKNKYGGPIFWMPLSPDHCQFWS